MSKRVYNNGYDAIRAMFDGYSSMDVAEFFIEGEYWPNSMTWGAAAARVRACWSPDSDEFWKLSELIAWSKHTGRTDVLDYWCDELGVDRPGERRKSTSAEMRRLMSELRDLEKHREAVLAAIEEQADRESREPPDSVVQLGVPPSVKRPRFEFAVEQHKKRQF